MKKLNVLKNKFSKERISAKEAVQLKGGDDKRKPIGSGSGGQLPIGGGAIPNDFSCFSLNTDLSDSRP